MAERFELNLKKKFKQLSLGMKTMLITILTLANDSKVVLLDEPTLGFDAIMRDQFNMLLSESYNRCPRVIIVSTHLIDEIAKVAEQLIIINKGRVLLHTDMEDIDERAYVLTGPTESVEPVITKLNCISKDIIGGMTAAYIYDDRVSPPDGVIIDRCSLQDFFVKLVEGESRRA
jgi:ABC-2 type transport system ATP-binding protein